MRKFSMTKTHTSKQVSATVRYDVIPLNRTRTEDVPRWRYFT